MPISAPPPLPDDAAMLRTLSRPAIEAGRAYAAREATSLLTRHQWREGDVALLQAAAARLGVPVPGAPGGVGD